MNMIIISKVLSSLDKAVLYICLFFFDSSSLLCCFTVKTRRQEFNYALIVTFFLICSSSDILAEERQLSQDLVQASKKEQEFRSIFQHVKATQSQRSPSELFAQHIVTIVHHSKGDFYLSLSPNLFVFFYWELGFGSCKS